MMEESTCPATPPLSKCPDTPPGPSKTTLSKWDSPDCKEKSRSPTPNRPTSPENCAICLGPLTNKSFTNSCIHQFCFVCLLEWSKVKAECPLCKVAFDSIIHNVRSQDDYDQYHVVRRSPPRPPVPSVVLAFQYQQGGYQPFSQWMADRLRPHNGYPGVNFEAIPSVPYHTQRGFHGTNGTSAFRRSIYDRDLWARAQPDLTGRYRDCSPEFYRENPAQLHRLGAFLNRELNVLLDSGARSMYIMDKILELIPQHSMTSAIFRSQVARLIGHRHAPHFCHELHMFASSPYDLVGYDRNVQYHPNGGAGVSIEIDESSEHNDSDDDDDVQIIESSIEARNLPSTSTGSVGMSRDIHPSLLHHSAVVNVSSDSESDDDAEGVQVVGYVKPRHERTPEIITLSSPEHPGASSHRAAETPRPSLSPNGLICISVEATVHHTWQNGLDVISDEPVGNVRRMCRGRHLVHRALESSNTSESPHSSSSSVDEWSSERPNTRRYSKRSVKGKSKKHSKQKKPRKSTVESDSEDENQPSTSRGRPSREQGRDSHGSSARSSKRSKSSVSSSRNAFLSDSDHSPVQIRSAIVQPTSRICSDSDDDSEPCDSKPHKIDATRNSDEGSGSWRVAESSSRSGRTHGVKQEQPHSSGYHASRYRHSTSPQHGKQKSNDWILNRKKHSHVERKPRSNPSHKDVKKRRDRSKSSELRSKKCRRKSRPLADSDDGLFESVKRKHIPLGYSDSD